jgi:hypothetical protein
MELSRSLSRRIAKLEQRLWYVEMPKFIVLCTNITKERRDHLAPGERIVVDWLSDVDGFANAIERITTEPEDQGRRCPEVITWSRWVRWIS